MGLSETEPVPVPAVLTVKPQSEGSIVRDTGRCSEFEAPVAVMETDPVYVAGARLPMLAETVMEDGVVLLSGETLNQPEEEADAFHVSSAPELLMVSGWLPGFEPPCFALKPVSEEGVATSLGAACSGLDTDLPTA